jgi:hypothetical protein
MRARSPLRCSRRFSHSLIPSSKVMHRGGKVLVSELRSTITDDDIAIGLTKVCFQRGKQTSHFKGVRTVLTLNRLDEPELRRGQV